MPATLTANERRRRAFSRALDEAMQAREFTQSELGRRLDHMRQSSISAWVNGHALPPDIETVFRIEKVLKLPPGHLSRLLGFLPVSDDVDVVEAIRTDSRLDAKARQMVLELRQELIDGAKRRHPASHKARSRSAA